MPLDDLVVSNELKEGLSYAKQAIPCSESDECPDVKEYAGIFLNSYCNMKLIKEGKKYEDKLYNCERFCAIGCAAVIIASTALPKIPAILLASVVGIATYFHKFPEHKIHEFYITGHEKNKELIREYERLSEEQVKDLLSRI